MVTKTKLRAWLSGRGAWLIWLGGVAVLVAFGAWVAGALGLGSEPVTTRLTSAGVVVAVLTGVIKVCMWLPAKLRGPDTVTDAAEQLREAVYRRAEETRETLLGGFRYADLTLAGPPGKADQPPRTWQRIAGLMRFWQGTMDETRTLSSIGTLYEEIDTGRLLVLGEPGSGKSVLALELILRLAEVKDEGRIPILLNMAAWNPREDLDDLLVAQLQADYGVSPRAAADLVAARPRRLLPVLDGLDEMDNEPPAGQADKWTPRRAIAALEKLNGRIDGRQAAPVVVTCRKERHDQLVGQRTDLQDAAKVEILPLPGKEIVRYLEPAPDTDPAVRERWQPFLDEVAKNQLLRGVLSTPWILHLVVSYAEADNEPQPLLDIARQNPGEEGKQEIRDLLLAKYVRAVTKIANRRAASRNELRDYAPDPDEVTRWMGTLAKHLEWQGAYDRQHPAGLSDVDIVPHLLWPAAGWLRVRIAHFAIGLLAPLLVIASVALPPTDWHRAMTEFVTELGVSPRLVPPLTVGALAVAGCLYVVAIKGACWSRWPTPYLVRRMRMPAMERLRMSVTSGLRDGPRIGAMATAMFGVILLIDALFGSQTFREGTQVGVVVKAVLVLLFMGVLSGLVGVAIAAVIASLGLREVSWDDDEAWSKSPRDALRAEVRLVVTTSVVLALATAGLTVWMAASGGRTSPWSILVEFPLVLLTVGLVARAQAWIRYVVFVMFAAKSGVLPLRLGRFLDWALIVGLLRSSGASYQFRHQELQRQLRSATAATQ